jgi:cytochrome P450
MLRSLRDFGFGKSTMRDLASEEVNDFVQWLKSEEGNSLILNRKFTLATINSLWMIMTGKRFPQNDPQVTAFLDSANKVFTEMLKSPVVIFFPKLAKALPKVFGWDRLMKLADENRAFLKKPIEEHQKEFSSENTPRDFIDSYLKEIESTTDPNSSFYKQSGEHNLRVVLSDLLDAGSETTSSTLVWAILYLCKDPKVQTKLQDELDQVVGKTRQATLEDRQKLPYMDAVVHETLRKSSIASLGIFHSALEDTTLGGYTIAKGTWISVNSYHVHHDPEIWGDPMNFRPERFLSPDGKTVLKNDALIPFSVGKRVCVGEQIARDSIFLFLTSILQRFEIKFDPAKPEPNMESSTEMFLQADPFYVIMKDRNA